MSKLLYISVLLAASLHAQELTTPSSLLKPRNFNPHPYEQYLREVEPEPTKQGPVLFPNDAPPPPRPPLIVTSRPLIESIARSELNPQPINNSLASSSRNQEYRIKPEYFVTNPYQIKPVYSGFESGVSLTVKPAYLYRGATYQPYAYPLTSPSPLDFGPYSKETKQRIGLDNRFDDFEAKPSLPPIYKAIGDYAKQKVSKIKHKHHHIPVHHIKSHRNEKLHDEGAEDYDNDGANYAFSYKVKDLKTGDDFSHQQQSVGSATNGEYRVRLPDGRMQIVSYTADENGYKADVRYDDNQEEIKGNAIEKRINHANHNYINHDHINPIPYNHNQIDHFHDPINHKPQFDVNNYIDNRRDYIKYSKPTGIDLNYYDFDHKNDVNLNDNHYEHKYTKPTDSYKVKEDFNEYSDQSKEYNTDYSVEYEGKHDKYEPHRSKFLQFTYTPKPTHVDERQFVYTPKPTNLGTIVVSNNYKNTGGLTELTQKSTVRPSYDEIKHLFGSSTPNIEINVPSTTPNPNNFDGTTERVVIIGTKPNLYTNVKNVPLATTPTTIYSTSNYSPSDLGTTSNYVSPQNYLVSTIQSLKERGNKPILSQHFIDRINKYLTFTK